MSATSTAFVAPPESIFIYVDTAFGGVHRRNNVRPIHDVHLNGVAGCYASYQRAPEELLQWMREHPNSAGRPSVAGYPGPTWTPVLPLDYDCKDDPARALVWLRHTLEQLQKRGVDLRVVEAFFSGHKGFHLDIPHALFGGFAPSPDLHKHLKRAAEMMLRDIPFDSSVYDKLRLWRLPNSKHEKSGLYKVPLSPEEVMTLDFASIRALAKAPRERFPRGEARPVEALVQLWRDAHQSLATRERTVAAPSDNERDTQTISAIAASWPHGGQDGQQPSRHTAYLLPIAGFLTRHTSVDHAVKMLVAAVQQAGDASFLHGRDWQQEITRAVESASTRLEAGQPVTGIPTLMEHFPVLAAVLHAVWVPPGRESASSSSSSASSALSSSSTPAIADLAESMGEVPPLPTFAWLSEAMEDAADTARAVWLDRYVSAASTLSPRSPRTLHEAAGLFALCTTVARRACITAGGKRLYPALMLVFVGRSTLYSKTGGLEVVRWLLRDAALLELLLPSSFTPQALAADLALHVPSSVREGGEIEQGRWVERHRHAGQRAIIRDELAGLLDDCSKDYNTGLLPLLLKLDGAPDQIDPDLTISRGLIEVENVCVNLLGATTPAALRQHASRPYHWHNGLFGRFALIAPDEAPHHAFWPEDVEGLPVGVVQDLRRIYEAFPRPHVVFDTVDVAGEPDKPQKVRIVGAKQDGYSALQVRVTRDAWEAWKRYDRALFTLAGRPEAPERLDATYGRLPSTAIRVALALAAAEWALQGKQAAQPPLLHVGHWAAAQQIAERWRHSAHAILATALRDESAETAAAAAMRLIAVLKKAGGPQKRGDLQRRLNWTKAELDTAIRASSGRVRESIDNQTGGRPSELVALVPEDNDTDVTTKGTKDHTREDGDDFSSNGTTKGRSDPPESPFSAFSSSEPPSAGEWPQSVAVQPAPAPTDALCTVCGNPAARRWKGEPRCFSCHPLGSVAPLEVA